MMIKSRVTAINTPAAIPAIVPVEEDTQFVNTVMSEHCYLLHDGMPTPILQLYSVTQQKVHR